MKTMILDWRKRWRSFWLCVHPLRALSEALAAQALLLLLLIWAVAANLDGMAARTITLLGAIVVLAGPYCILWCNFRMRAPLWHWGWRLLLYTGMGLVIGVVPSLMFTFVLRSRSGVVFRISSLVFFAAWLAAFTAAFLISHLGVWLLIVWDRLQRTHLIWSLTHAHLVVVALGAALLSMLIVGSNTYFSIQNNHAVSLSILPILFVLFIVTVIALLVVLPPSAVFSYIFARRITRRLSPLTAATSALRDGEYGVRVIVKGEDEVAQLQENFNAMAADLERAVHDLQAERDTVARLLEARRQLIASVSHELRTPVATLRGYLESTRIHWDGTPPSTLRRDLEVMERETIHLQNLINDLFTLARAEVNRLDLRREPTDVALLAQRIVEMMAPLAWQGSRVEIAAEIAPDLPLALVDASRLEQALQNLLHNATRHTSPGGIIAVAAFAEANDIVLQVKDTGEGIAPEDLPHIFERFYRSERARAQPNSGTGLGLALVKELTEAMGGSVAVESQLGVGSCFTLRVPRAADMGAARHDGTPGESGERAVILVPVDSRR